MGINSRAEFLNLAGIVEGSLILAAIVGGWLVGVSPWAIMTWSWAALGVGLLGTLPMLSLFFVATGPKEVAVELLGAALSQCRWYDLVLLAALAGLSEELLFRGVLQPWLSEWNPLFGLIACNVVFGLLHAVTPSYALLATGVGLYLSWLTYGIGEPNLWRAIIAHGVYDLLAFVLVIREFQRRRRERLEESP